MKQVWLLLQPSRGLATDVLKLLRHCIFQGTRSASVDEALESRIMRRLVGAWASEDGSSTSLGNNWLYVSLCFAYEEGLEAHTFIRVDEEWALIWTPSRTDSLDIDVETCVLAAELCER